MASSQPETSARSGTEPALHIASCMYGVITTRDISQIWDITRPAYCVMHAWRHHNQRHQPDLGPKLPCILRHARMASSQPETSARSGTETATYAWCRHSQKIRTLTLTQALLSLPRLTFRDIIDDTSYTFSTSIFKSVD